MQQDFQLHIELSKARLGHGGKEAIIRKLLEQALNRMAESGELKGRLYDDETGNSLGNYDLA